ncbi:MAG: ATP-binding cassette domain-containing protein, partial [Clostridia bacterium]|nr:ATP-binding cassette domain-containing protein [Clostridia bacterium]
MELKLTNVTKRYGKKTALDGFSYSFREGIYGVLGANGAGKSTLMNLITDNVRRDGGDIELDGTDVLKLGNGFRELLGFMPQQQGLYESMTAEAFLAYMARLKRIPSRKIMGEITRVLDLTN